MAGRCARGKLCSGFMQFGEVDLVRNSWPLMKFSASWSHSVSQSVTNELR